MIDPQARAAAQPFWVALGVLSVIFHLSLIFSGLTPNLVSRPLHMALALPWVFLVFDRPGASKWFHAGLGVFAIAACLWIAINHNTLGDQYGRLEGYLQHGIAIMLVVTVLEMARRSIGWPLPTVAGVALLYGMFGEAVPGEFGHPGLPLASFLGTLTIAEGGLWGSLTGVSVNIVAVFVILGAMLNAGEAGQGFMNVATAAAGRLKGGAAKVSVLASALFGSISGSASANVASTGAITLPAMRKLGYPKSLAAAVEAVASSGGQIMPPLMGAGAFVMVELTGVPYTQIIVAAMLPAVLYFLTVWAGINAYARRYALKDLPQEDLPTRRQLIVTTLFFLVPFAVLLERLFVSGYTPQYAAATAIVFASGLLIVNSNFDVSLTRCRERLADACLSAGKQIATIAAIILCASLIIGVLGQTGLGVKITSLIISAADEKLWPALALTGLACLILGMEVPTTAAYVICVSVAGPALQQLGLEPLLVHLFVFWFALLSTITPPVCGTVFIAAGMVNANWLRVAVSAMALGVGLYLVPLGMIANPELIAPVDAPGAALLAFGKLGVGLIGVSYAVIAPLSWALRCGLLIGGLSLLFLDNLVVVFATWFAL